MPRLSRKAIISCVFSKVSNFLQGAQPSSTIKDDSVGEICNFGEYSLSTRRGIPAEVSVGNFRPQVNNYVM
jgi:hypothetical protein